MNSSRYWVVRALAAGTLLLASGCVASPDPAALSPSAASPAAASPSYSGHELLSRPLRLPRLAPSDACPVTTTRQSHLGVDDGLGSAPMFPVAYYFAYGTELRLREQDREADGYRVKVRWQGFGYEGPVLIRMGRLDGEGHGDVEIGEKVEGGRLVRLSSLQRQDFPGVTLVSGPGCFAYQVDGDSFTEVIVFEAREVPE